MKKFLRDNGIFLVVIAVLLALVLFVGASILGYDPVSSVLNVLGTPFRAASSAIAEWTEERYERAFRYEQLEAENEALRQQVAQLEEDAREGADARREVERLRDLLGLSNQRPELKYQDAAVTQRSSTNWGSDLTLNKGTAQGVAVNDCVVDQYGNLVGIVTEAGLNWSLVTTLLDPDTKLGGRLPRIDDDAILEGDFTLMTQGLLKLTYVPTESQIISGDRVVTSGLGGLYPEGLLVGTVRTLHTEPDGISRYGVVEPAADIAGVRYVYIIVDF